VGGRLLITEVFGGAGPAILARDSLPGTAAAEAESLTAAAEALYRERLPGLSVIQETQGGSKYDFVVDSMMRTTGAVTAVLQAGVADRHSAYVDGGDEATVVGAITLRVRSAPSRASTDGQSESQCFDCGMANCDGGCADVGRPRAAGGDARYGEVLACAVSYHHTRSGVGRLLVAWATANAAAEGLRFLLVSASTDVVRFWERLGFGLPPAHCAEACRGLQGEFEGSVVLHREVPAAVGAAGSHPQVDESPLIDAMAALRSRSRAAGHKRVRQRRGEPDEV
jgi:GNAT superfamily N-acetyltransferase